MKKIALVSIIILTLFTSDMFANTNKLALELARSKNLAGTINRVNIIKNFINLYAMQEGRLPTGMTELLTKYQGLPKKGFLNTSIISFTVPVNSNIIKFSNILPLNSSNLIKQIYKNSSNLAPTAIVKADLTMELLLDTKTIAFLAYINDINNSNNFIQLDNPGCNSTNEHKLWYKPNSIGGFTISYCLAGLWDDTMNNVILRDTKSDLDDIKPQSGTIGYVKETATTAKRYIFSSKYDKWLEINN